MKANNARFTMEEMKSRLSTLWIFVLFNMAFADIIGFVEPGTLETLMAGDVGFELTPAIMVVISLIQAIPIAMVLLSRFLDYRMNRWANIVAAIITLVYIIGGGSWDKASYIVFAMLEILALLYIIWFAWTWRAPERA